MQQVSIEGNARKRGTSHGELLKEKIHETKAFYEKVFDMDQEDVFARAERFRELIRDYDPEYVEEIDGIAEASGLDRHWVYALNSRTELLSLKPPAHLNECTALYFRSSSILGQTWDWGKPLEDLIVLMSIRRSDGHTIRMITEPGIIGKIGMNSAGIGTCLNLLRTGPLDVGVPVHIVLRAILDSRSIEEARTVVTRAGGGKASNILAGNDGGQCLDVEFAGEQHFIYDPPLDVVTHTNHFLAEAGHDEPLTDLRSSLCRFRIASERGRALTGFGVDDMVDLLSDRSATFPILRKYVRDPNNLVGQIGTVCTVIMELQARTMHVRMGNDASEKTTPYYVD